MKAGVINGIDFDILLDAAKNNIHFNINQLLYVDRTLEMYRETGVFMWSSAEHRPPTFTSFEDGKFKVVVAGKEYWSDSELGAHIIRRALDPNYGVLIRNPLRDNV